MSKFSEMAAPLAGKFGLTVKDAEQFLLQMTEVLNDGLREDKQVKIKGMGTFKVTSVSARKSVNVNTGEPIVISSRDKITFTPDASLRDRVNSPFAQFETVVVNDGVELEESISTASHLSPQREAEQQPPSPASQPELSTLTEETPAEPETSIPSKKAKGRYRAWFGTVALLLLLAVFGAFYFLRDATTAKSGGEQETKATEEQMATEKREVAKEQAVPEKENVKQENTDYASYPIMQYGAYEFDGVAAEVTVKKGQTLVTISRQYFGPSPGADQYIEAFNGKREFKEGDVIKIPKLVLKKKNKKL